MGTRRQASARPGGSNRCSSRAKGTLLSRRPVDQSASFVRATRERPSRAPSNGAFQDLRRQRLRHSESSEIRLPRVFRETSNRSLSGSRCRNAVGVGALMWGGPAQRHGPFNGTEGRRRGTASTRERRADEEIPPRRHAINTPSSQLRERALFGWPHVSQLDRL